MGYGDEIMAAGEAYRLAQANPGAKIVIGPRGGHSWSIIYENIDCIATAPDDGVTQLWLENYTGKRPYIDYERTTPERMVYAEGFRAERGHVVLSDAERAWAERRTARLGRFVLVEPNTKGTFGGNKAWPWEHWAAFADLARARGVKLVQAGLAVGDDGTLIRTLPGAYRVATPTIRQALALLDRAACVVTTDGALHHGAAALGRKAVVIWGGRTDPAVLGYRDHANLIGSDEFCGRMVRCEHCRRAMSNITPDRVLGSLLEQLT